MTGKKRSFGTVRQLPSGRWQARYTGPDGIRYKAPTTFLTEKDAQAWITTEQADVIRNQWLPTAEDAPDVPFGEYAEAWLKDRDLKPTTRNLYRGILDQRILPTFAAMPLTEITPEKVRRWHALVAPGKPTAKAHAYALLRTILGTAAGDELIPANPCKVKGAGTAARKKAIRPATIDEVVAIADHMGKADPKYRVLVLLTAWTALRFGEAVELRRRDVHLVATKQKNGTTDYSGALLIRRAVTRVKGERIQGDPKAGSARDVAIPPHLVPVVQAHLDDNVGEEPDALLFPAAKDPTLTLSHTAMVKVFYPARKAAGREDLTFHGLRHTGATLAAQTGATLAELMARLGHTTSAAAMRYQHAAAGRDAEIARRLSALTEGKKS